MRRLIFILLLMACAVSSIAGQENWFDNKPIADIRFNGLRSVSQNDLYGLMRPYIGQKYTDALSWEIQSKLYALDYFDLIVPEVQEGENGPSAIILFFDVQEKPLVSEVIFRGNSKIRRGELSDAVFVKIDDLFSPGSLSIDEQAIKELYTEKGFVDSEVNAEYEIDGESNTVQVTFDVAEGTQTKISEIRFVGNDKHISDGSLNRIMTTKAQSLFNKGLFVETKLQEDIKAIERYYGDQGMIDAVITDVKRDIVFDEDDQSNKMIITIVIEEGEPWLYGGIEFQGNQIYSTEELEAVVTQIPGKTFDFSKFQLDYQRVTDLYYANGYTFNTFAYEENRDKATQTVFYTVKITEYDRVHIGKIIIRGNTKTKSYVIRREIPIVEGEVFSKSKIVEGTLNLYNLRFFDVVEPMPRPGDEDGLVDLIVNVSEGKTSEITFGLSFSGGADFPISGMISWKDHNFLGRNQIIGGSVNISPDVQKVSLEFQEPRLLGERWGGGATLSYTHQNHHSVNQDKDLNGVPDPYSTWAEYDELAETMPQDSLMVYASHNIAVGLNTGYSWITRIGRLGLSSGLSFSWQYIVYDANVYTPQNALIRQNLDNWNYSDSLSLRLFWDTRDLQYDPSKGFLLSQSFTYAGLLENQSSRNYIMSASRFHWSQELFNIPVGKKEGKFRSVFSFETVFRALFDKPWRETVGDIVETNGFIIDGVFVARGWPVQNSEYYRFMWDNTITLKFPIVPNILAFDLFLDAVGAWRDLSGEISALDNWQGNDWFFSLGAGFRFANPQFPIGIYVVKRFQWKDDTFTWFPDPPGSNSYEFKDAGLDLVISFDLDIN